MGNRTDWICVGPVKDIPTWVTGLASPVTVRWGIKLGGPNYWGGLSLPFHLHIHEYNWWNPFRWRQK